MYSPQMVLWTAVAASQQCFVWQYPVDLQAVHSLVESLPLMTQRVMAVGLRPARLSMS